MHMSTSHQCGYCDNLFANLAEHENVHETEACTECEQKFVTAASLQSHMKRAHQIKCDSCEERSDRAAMAAAEAMSPEAPENEIPKVIGPDSAAL